MIFSKRAHAFVLLILIVLFSAILFVSKFNILLTFLFLTICLSLIVDKMNSKGCHCLFAGVLSTLIILGSQIQFSTVGASYKENIIQTNLSLEKSIVFLGCFIIIFFFLSGLEYLVFNFKLHPRTRRDLNSVLDQPWIIFIFIMIFWTPYLLTLYPGCVLPDSLSSINQALGNRPLSNHHPVFFTLFLKFFINIFSFLGLNKSIFIYTLVQTIIFASVLIYFVFWLKKYGIPRYFRLSILIYFAIAPVFPIYALNVQKDTLFVSYLFLFTLKCIDVVVSKRKNNWTIAVLVISGVLATFYRNNGLYVVFLTLSVVTVILIKQNKYRQSITIFGAYCTFTFLLINPFVSRNSVPTAAAESLGVPLQQVSRAIVLHGEMSKEDKKYLNQLLPISEYEKYSPMLADSIKWNPKFNNEFLNDNPKEFIKIWADLLPHNFKIYVDAYLLNTYGFWAPFEKNEYGFLDTRVNTNNLNIKQVDLIKLLTGSNVMSRVIERRNFLGSGTLFCLMIVGFYLYWLKGRKLLWIGYLPSLLTWLSIMVATPVAFSLRYVFILAVSLPLFFCLPFLKLNSK